MYNPALISQAPVSAMYGNGFQSYRKMEMAYPLNVFADPYSQIDEKRKMLMQATASNRSQLGNAMMSGGGPQTTQAMQQLNAARQPKSSLMKEDEYKQIGGMLADFFQPTQPTVSQQVSQIIKKGPSLTSDAVDISKIMNGGLLGPVQ